MLAIYLGAGFSKWAAGLPVGSELFDFNVEPFGIREQRKLERTTSLKLAWDNTHPGGLAEQFIAHVLGCHDVCSTEDTIWYVVRRMSDPYVWQEWHAGRPRRHVLMIDENRKWDRPGVYKTADFLRQCGARMSGVVTLNYDLLVEYALGSRGFNYGITGEILQGRGPYPVSQWRNPVTLVGHLPLAKLHGSISWDATGRYTDGRRGLSGKALIVPPSPEKHRPMELDDQWNLSKTIIERASRMIVFGFAFNDYDQAVLAHLREAGSNLNRIAIIDICSREEAARRLWPSARVESFQPPPEGTPGIKAWLAMT
ncbi:MAG: SIR2 family protein [Armatimonadota bacterium]|nr:SIR2 family protein [Armatimonadota bacterium]